jgi:SnoaL-like domain
VLIRPGVELEIVEMEEQP